MPKSLSIVAATLAALVLSGCASPSLTTQLASTGAKAPDHIQTGPRAPSPTESRQIEDVFAELRQSGVIDPTTEPQLAEQLRQSDPSIWPLVVEQFRAVQAYRRDALKRSSALASAAKVEGDSPIVAEMKIATDLRRLPPTDGTAAVGPVQDVYPSTPASPDEYPVTQASYAAAPGQWRQRLNEAIEALEAETPPSSNNPAEVAQHARLRMLYAVAGRREDAARPIPDASPATQQFVSKELQGLGSWLDVAEAADPAARTVEAKAALSEALAKLAETAPLLVRNATFCSEVLSFGCVKRFDKCEFFQDQNVLLYAELENFTSEPIDKGFRTSLRSGYQIVDHLGQQVVWHEFAPTQDHCKSPRRDFFIAYRIRLPKQITPGKYSMRLLVQDTARQKSGQASLEFTVKEGKAEKPKGKTDGGKEVAK
jgi:hypothetical protein